MLHRSYIVPRPVSFSVLEVEDPPPPPHDLPRGEQERLGQVAPQNRHVAESVAESVGRAVTEPVQYEPGTEAVDVPLGLGEDAFRVRVDIAEQGLVFVCTEQSEEVGEEL